MDDYKRDPLDSNKFLPIDYREELENLRLKYVKLEQALAIAKQAMNLCLSNEHPNSDWSPESLRLALKQIDDLVK